MQADPRRTLVIEDSVSGVTAAKAAGMTVWGLSGAAIIGPAMAGLCCTMRGPTAYLSEWRIFGRMNRKKFDGRADSEKIASGRSGPAGWLYFIAGHTRTKSPECSRSRALGAAPGFIVSRRAPDHLPAGTSDCGMHGVGRAPEGLVSSRLLRSGADRSGGTACGYRNCRARANILESTLRTEKPTIVALGTGRAVRAAVERVSPIDCPNHQIVSLVGNISADGSASFFDTVGRLADRTKARHYPMPLPFLMSSRANATRCSGLIRLPK